MEYTARFPSVQVRMARIEEPEEGEPSRVCILLGDGGLPVCVVESAAFETLYQRIDGDAEVPVRRKRRAAEPSAAVSSAMEPVAHENGHAPDLGGVEDDILRFIGKGNGFHTSGDLIRLTKRTPSSVYQALSRMKSNGRIETRKDDEGDGQSKWWLMGDE